MIRNKIAEGVVKCHEMVITCNCSMFIMTNFDVSEWEAILANLYPWLDERSNKFFELSQTINQH